MSVSLKDAVEAMVEQIKRDNPEMSNVEITNVEYAGMFDGWNRWTVTLSNGEIIPFEARMPKDKLN